MKIFTGVFHLSGSTTTGETIEYGPNPVSDT